MTGVFTRRFAPARAEPLRPGEIPAMRGVFGAIGGVDFSRVHFPGGFSLIPQTPLQAVFFCLPAQGVLTVRTEAESLSATPETALAVDTIAAQSLEIPAGHAHCALIISRALLVERLSVLLGRAVVSSLAFEPLMAAGSEPVPALRSLLHFLTAPDFAGELNGARLTATHIHELLIDFVLERWPNSYSEALNRPPPMVAPRHVKCAIDLIRDNPQHISSGAELAALSGVSLRSLQAGFRQFAGTSITTYQRRVRLERAREDILREPGTSVQDIALRWGFTNTGRFTRYFREAYGVSPAQLAKR
ncbi:AraC family transcriptional regulator [Acetobacter musti]|nr:helix-turn-helix transcriptional regulator [Acetobacter musti]